MLFLERRGHLRSKKREIAREQQGESGFTVLESLVAMALLAAAFIPLLQMQFQFVKATETLERTQDRIRQEGLAHSFLQTVNFAQLPAGSIVLDRTNIEWSAIEVGEARRQKVNDGVDGRFEVFFYNVSVVITSEYDQSNSSRMIDTSWTYFMPAIGWAPKSPIVSGL